MAVHYEPPRQNRGGSLRELLMSENQGPSFGSQLGNVLSQEFARQQAAKDQQAQMLAEQQQKAQQGALFAQLLSGGMGGGGGNFNGGAMGPQGSMSPEQMKLSAARSMQQAEAQQQAAKPIPFHQIPWEEIAQKAVAGNLPKSDILALHKEHEEAIARAQNQELQKENNEIKRERNEISREAPSRAALTKRLGEIKEEGKQAKINHKNYKTLLALSKSGEVREGVAGRISKLLKINDIFSTPATQVADKMISQINTINLTGTGQRGIAIYKELEKGQLSTNMDKESFDYIAQAGSSIAEANSLFADVVDKIADKYQAEGKQIPLNIESIAMKNLEPQLKKLDKEADKSLDDFLGSLNKQNNASKGNAKFPIPQGANFGSLLINPNNLSQKDVYLGNNNVISEDIFRKASDMLEKQAPATQNKGRKVINRELGFNLVSDGKNWNISQ